MARVVLFGIGRAADTAFRYLKADSEHEVVAFTVDQEFVNEEDQEFHSLPVVNFAKLPELYPPTDFQVFVSMGYHGMNSVRKDKFLTVKNLGYSCISYVSSTNQFIERPSIGENCFILGNQSIDLDVKIGDNVVMWSQNHIGDRSVIEDNVWITSDVSISGDVTVKDSCFLGVNSTICHDITLAPKTFVGAGAVIANNTDEGGVYIEPAAKKGAMNSERFLSMMNIS